MFIVEQYGEVLELPVIFDVKMIPFDLVSALTMIGAADLGAVAIFDMSLEDFLEMKSEVYNYGK